MPVPTAKSLIVPAPQLPRSPAPRLRVIGALTLPLLGATGCSGGKDEPSEGESACMTMFTAICEASIENTCGLSDSGAPGGTVSECTAELQAALSDNPALNQEAADACAEVLRAPECGDPAWERAFEECLFQTVFTCVEFGDSGWSTDSGWSWDSGWDWDSGDGGGDGGDGGGGGVDSCDWPDIGICFEFEGYDDTEGWCADIGSAYSIATSYSSEGCPLTDGECALPAGGDFPEPVTAYYYDFSATDAESACESSGGTWNG
jgi:hypothetical protein